MFSFSILSEIFLPKGISQIESVSITLLISPFSLGILMLALNKNPWNEGVW